MAHDPDDRPTAEHIQESRWFDDLEKSLEEGPSHIVKM